MIILVSLAVGAVFTALALYARSHRAPYNKQNDLCGTAEGWFWFWAATGTLLGLVSLLVVFLTNAWNVEAITELGQREALYRERAEQLCEEFRTELLKYSSIELEIFKRISPSNLSLYAVRYPEIRSSEVLRDLANKVGWYWGEVYAVKKDRLHREAVCRFLRCWWQWL